MTTLFALLLVPQAWLWIAPEASIGAVGNPACLVALAGVVVWGAVTRRRRSRDLHAAGLPAAEPKGGVARGASPSRSPGAALPKRQ